MQIINANEEYHLIYIKFNFSNFSALKVKTAENFVLF